MRINEAAEQLGLSQRALKYYEKEGLLEVRRDENGYRNYNTQDLERLKKISLYRKLGIAIKDIESLLNTEDPARLQGNSGAEARSAAAGSDSAAIVGKIFERWQSG